MGCAVCGGGAVNSAGCAVVVEAREPDAVAASCGTSAPRPAPAADSVPAPGVPDAPEDASPAAQILLLPAAADETSASCCSPAGDFGSLAAAAYVAVANFLLP